MSAQHTPGPWSLTEPRMGAFNQALMSVVTADKRYVADIQPTAAQTHRARNNRMVCRKVFGPEDMANARLIAAAPELLAVAQMVVDASDLSGVNGPLGDAARAALSTALGEDQ